MNKEMQEKVQQLFEDTEHPMTLQQIADALGLGYHAVHSCVAKFYSREVRLARKVQNYSISKRGDKNPMTGKYGELHPNYIGEVADGKGYIMVLKPFWFTGRKGSKYVFKHTIVFCEHFGLTELPEGFVVHHIDGDMTNNDINNLALMTLSAHVKLHSILKGATTISKESRVSTRSA